MTWQEVLLMLLIAHCVPQAGRVWAETATAARTTDTVESFIVDVRVELDF